jgi:hypothetical protein
LHALAVECHRRLKAEIAINEAVHAMGCL